MNQFQVLLRDTGWGEGYPLGNQLGDAVALAESKVCVAVVEEEDLDLTVYYSLD